MTQRLKTKVKYTTFQLMDNQLLKLQSTCKETAQFAIQKALHYFEDFCHQLERKKRDLIKVYTTM